MSELPGKCCGHPVPTVGLADGRAVTAWCSRCGALFRRCNKESWAKFTPDHSRRFGASFLDAIKEPAA